MKRTILLNGAVRDKEEFILIVDYILHNRKAAEKGVKLVISTWHEDVVANHELFSWLSGEGVRIVGSPGLSDGGPANVYRQWRTLDAGLNHCDDDALILKGRTDKFLLRKDVIDAFIKGDFHSAALDDMVTHQRLAVEHISLSLPFMAKDMIYLGTMPALRKMVHFSTRTAYTADHIFNGIGPECFLWLEYAKTQSDIMRIVQKTDMRQLSNQMLVNEKTLAYDWNTIPAPAAILYKRWYSIFDNNFCFLSDILACSPAPSWIIDEGSWRYETGDRAEFEAIRNKLPTKEPSIDLLADLPYLNSSSEHTFEKHASKPGHPFPQLAEKIYSDNSRPFSDIVLIRRSIIEHELASSSPDSKKLTSALHWNIRQRDRGALNLSYDWLMKNAPETKYISREDQFFVIERMVDFFTFQADYSSIEKAIDRVPELFDKPELYIRVAEHHFRKFRRFRALYWFIKGYRCMPSSLGAAHGLGCTLLDLHLPHLALPFLKRAHAIAPNDQTAAFTLLRAYHRSGQTDNARSMLMLLSSNLRVEAERILNA